MDAAVRIEDRPLAGSPPWWAWPVLLPGPLLAWHAVIADELSRTPDAPGWFAAPSVAWACVGAVVVALLAETTFYVILWGARGRRLPFATSALVLLQLSLMEAAVSGWVRPGSGASWLAVVLAGARATWGEPPPGGFESAFGSFGLLALVRMSVWAWVQSEATGRRWREAALLVVAVWLASHLAQGWTMELVRGRSMMP